MHNSSPSFTDYTQAESKILNERGFVYRSTGQPPSRLRSPSNRSSRMAAVAPFDSGSNEPTPNKPSVRLPPQQTSSTDSLNNLSNCESEISSAEPVSAVSANPVQEKKLTSLPGIGWSMKWKEQTGIDSLSVDGADSATTEEAEKGNKLFKEIQKTHPFENSRQKTISSTLSSASRGKMHYRINIPPLTKWQQNLTTYPRYSSTIARATMMNQGALGNPLYISSSRPTVSIPFRGAIRSQGQSAPNGPKLVPIQQPSQQETNSTDIQYIRNNSNSLEKQHKSTVDLAWEGLVPVPEPFNSQGVPEITSASYGSQSLLDTPIFPFPHTTDMDTFSFHPMLPHTPSNPFFGDSSLDLLHTFESQGRHSPLSTFKATGAPFQKQSTENTAKSHSPCYDWNYYFECSKMKDNECQKMHICEICASSEHRAAQHWHHLATAPLPEIQIQPKLSTPTAPPDSPTLSAVKDRVRLFVPSSSMNFSVETHSKDSRVPLFVPSLGLEGSHKAAAQSERLRRRKLQSRSKTTPPQEVRIPQAEAGMGNDIPSTVKNQRIPIMAPPTSPFDKAVEVILPPPARPFQSANAVGNSSTPDNSPTAKLRVTAPVFEPSHAGAWVPFSSPTNQFGSLFQIPSKEKKKIEIVAPTKKGKEVARDDASETAKVKKPANNREYKGNSHKGEGKKVRLESTKSKTGRSEPTRETAFKEILGSSPIQRPLDTFADTDWSAPGPSTPCPTSAAAAVYLKDLSKTGSFLPRASQAITSVTTVKSVSALSVASFPSDTLENNVLKILDEQLEAIIGKESPETIAATLETIIEICSTPLTETCPHTCQFDISSNAPTASNSHSTTWPCHESQNSIAQTTFFTLRDFAEDDTFCPKSHTDRPRSSDSSSTAPLSSPETPKDMADQTPLRERIERMMSCAASKGIGQCHCGLGDWFRHGQG